jgi:hypothetical protein
MITNNLLLKLKERNNENIIKARDVLQSMQGKIELLRDLKIEMDIRHGASSYDIMLIAQFASMEDFDAYLAHPVHIEVAKYIASVLESTAAVCYESWLEHRATMRLSDIMTDSWDSRNEKAGNNVRKMPVNKSYHWIDQRSDETDHLPSGANKCPCASITLSPLPTRPVFIGTSFATGSLLDGKLGTLVVFQASTHLKSGHLRNWGCITRVLLPKTLTPINDTNLPRMLFNETPRSAGVVSRRRESVFWKSGNSIKSMKASLLC